jgi:hypothetical protein
MQENAGYIRLARQVTDYIEEYIEDDKHLRKATGFYESPIIGC